MNWEVSPSYFLKFVKHIYISNPYNPTARPLDNETSLWKVINFISFPSSPSPLGHRLNTSILCSVCSPMSELNFTPVFMRICPFIYIKPFIAPSALLISVIIVVTFPFESQFWKFVLSLSISLGF